MTKHLKILFMVVALIGLIGLMAGSAFAAATVGDTGTSYNGTTTVTATSVSAEALGKNRTSADRLKIYYDPNAAINVNDVLTVSFTNGLKVYEAEIKLCEWTAATISSSIATRQSGTDTVSGVDSVQFLITTSPTSTNLLFFAAACPALSTPYTNTADALDVIVAKDTAAGTGLGVSVAVTRAGTGTVSALSASSTFYNVANEFSMTAPTLVTKYIRVEDSMTKVGDLGATSGTTKVTGGALALTDADYSTGLGIEVSPASTKVLPNTGDKNTITITGSMAGVSRICFDDSTCSSSSTKTFTIDSLNAIATYILTSTTAFGDVEKAVTFIFDGTTALTARTFKISNALDFSSSDYKDRSSLLSTSDYVQLTFSGVQLLIPLVKTDTVNGMETYIKLQSKSTSTATTANKVIATIVSSDNSLVTYDAGAITSGTAKTISGTDLQTAVTNAGKTVSGTGGFAAVIYVNANEGDVFSYANTCDISGCKRIPVRTYQKSSDPASTIYMYVE